jgi:hypothetical protein
MYAVSFINQLENSKAEARDKDIIFHAIPLNGNFVVTAGTTRSVHIHLAPEGFFRMSANSPSNILNIPKRSESIEDKVLECPLKKWENGGISQRKGNEKFCVCAGSVCSRCSGLHLST